MPIYVAAGFSTAFLPVWLTVRGLTPADIGEVLGLATLCRLLAVPAWGWIADGVGRRRPVLLASTALTAFFSAAYLPAAGFAPLLLVTALQGMAAAALMPLTDTLALALAGDGRLDYGRVRAVGSFAFMAATAAAGSLVAGFGARIVPLALTLCYALAIPLLWPVPEAGPPPRAPRATGGLRLLSSRPFLLTMAASALIQSAHGAYYGLATLHWRAHGISDVTIGLLWSEGVLAEIMLFVFGRRLADRLGPAGLTACAALAGMLRWSVLGLSTALPALLAVQMLHGATYGMQHLSAMRMLSHFVPPERAAMAQTVHATLGVAVPTGLVTWAAGAVYDGSGRVFLLMALLGAGGLLVAPGLRAATAHS